MPSKELVLADSDSIWRQKDEHELTPEQLVVKRQMDQEWFDTCEARAKAFLLLPDGSRREYTQEEWDAWNTEGNVLWLDFEARAKEAGLYAVITLDEQIAQAEQSVAMALAAVQSANAEVSRLTAVKADAIAREEAKQAEIGGKPINETLPGAKGA